MNKEINNPYGWGKDNNVSVNESEANKMLAFAQYYHQAMQQKQTGEAMSASDWLKENYSYEHILYSRREMMERYAAYRLEQAQLIN